MTTRKTPQQFVLIVRRGVNLTTSLIGCIQGHTEDGNAFIDIYHRSMSEAYDKLPRWIRLLLQIGIPYPAYRVFLENQAGSSTWVTAYKFTDTYRGLRIFVSDDAKSDIEKWKTIKIIIQ